MQGTGYIYETFLRPYIAEHESEIDRRLMQLKVKAWDLAVFYWQNWTSLGQTTLFQLVQQLASNSGKVSGTTAKVD